MQDDDPLTDESGRLEAIRRYGLLEAGSDPICDRILRIAREVYAVPMAALSVIDDERQIFRAELGIGCSSTSREDAFCSHTILSYEPLCVADAREDPRFAENPLVTGPPHLRAYMGVPLTLGSGYNTGALCVLDRIARPDFAPRHSGLLHDLSDVLMQVMEVRMLSRTDALTGLASRRHFLDELGREVSRSRRHARPVSVGLLDIDHFKQVNDAHGHGVGDRVLRMVAERMRACLREQDMIGRLGGEEFGIIFPETAGDKALRAARRLRAAVSGAPFDCESCTLSLSVSIGVATVEGEGCAPAPLMEHADDALYAAKRGGRNCVRLASEDVNDGWRIAG